MKELLQKIKLLTKLRIIGSILSFPFCILIFAFVNGSFDYISIKNSDNTLARLSLCVIIFLSNVFIWINYDKEKG